MDTLLSLDWDYVVGALPVPDSTLLAGVRAGTPGLWEDWLGRAWARTRQRPQTPEAGPPEGWAPPSWAALEADFPMLVPWRELFGHLREVAPDAPWLVAEGHNEALRAIEPGRPVRVVNLDSHADLVSHGRDRLETSAVPAVGNWAGHGLVRGSIAEYRCFYPGWHLDTGQGEGWGLGSLTARLGRHPRLADLMGRVCLEVAPSAAAPLAGLELGRVSAVLLAHSSPWCAPQHDAAFIELVAASGASRLTPIADRRDPGRLAWLLPDLR